VDASYPMLGTSRAMLDVVEEALSVAPTDSKVLIYGESGVGKELLARFVHHHSPRHRRPMASINCAGVPESLLESELFGHARGSFTDAHADRRGVFETADGGTLFLDEVGEMGARMQALLLRVLESGEIQRVGSERISSRVDVRVISATNRDLLQHTKDKHFREDLYYRLNVVCLVIPALRQRVEDIRLLFQFYLDAMSTRFGVAPCQVSEEAYEYLEAYHWPGNIRELRNVTERVALRHPGGVLSVDALPRELVSNWKAAPAIAAATPTDAMVHAYYDRIVNGSESFWTVIYEPFMLRDLTRETVRAVVRQGLHQSKGSYRLLARLFHLPGTDYRKFQDFLQKYDCHLPINPVRNTSEDRQVRAG
jgi:transcriptional regulator with GAF, ATPase, and Fis domain